MWPVVHSLPIPDVYMTSQVAQYKEFACQAGDWVQSLSQEDPLEKRTVTHFRILAWRISWAEEPGRLQSIGYQKSQTRLSH